MDKPSSPHQPQSPPMPNVSEPTYEQSASEPGTVTMRWKVNMAIDLDVAELGEAFRVAGVEANRNQIAHVAEAIMNIMARKAPRANQIPLPVPAQAPPVRPVQSPPVQEAPTPIPTEQAHSPFSEVPPTHPEVQSPFSQERSPAPEMPSIFQDAPTPLPEVPSSLPELPTALPDVPMSLPEVSTSIPEAPLSLSDAPISLPEVQDAIPGAQTPLQAVVAAAVASDAQTAASAPEVKASSTA